MSEPSRPPQLPALMRALKASLKKQGIRQADIADRLHVGVATVRRWLSGQGLTMDRFEELCSLANITFAELTEEIASAAPGRQTRFTPSQERALAQDQALSFLFFSLLHGWAPEASQTDLQITSETLSQLLNRLVRLGLIDLSAAGRVRLRTIPTVSWRRGGPLARHFHERVRHLVLDADYGSSELFYLSDVAKLSIAAQQRIRELMERLRHDVHEIAAIDRRAPEQDRSWQALFLLLRPLDMAAVRRSIAAGRGVGILPPSIGSGSPTAVGGLTGSD